MPQNIITGYMACLFKVKIIIGKILEEEFKVQEVAEKLKLQLKKLELIDYY